MAGARFDRTIEISDADCNGEQNLADYLWNKIADWVCGTQVNEAKALLEKLCHPEKQIFNGLTPAGLNMLNRDSFSKLLNMVGADYKDNFREVEDPNDYTTDYQLVIKGKIVFSTINALRQFENTYSG